MWLINLFTFSSLLPSFLSLSLFSLITSLDVQIESMLQFYFEIKINLLFSLLLLISIFKNNLFFSFVLFGPLLVTAPFCRFLFCFHFLCFSCFVALLSNLINLYQPLCTFLFVPSSFSPFLFFFELALAFVQTTPNPLLSFIWTSIASTNVANDTATKVTPSLVSNNIISFKAIFVGKNAFLFIEHLLSLFFHFFYPKLSLSLCMCVYHNFSNSSSFFSFYKK